jgi:hypothetical protein
LFIYVCNLLLRRVDDLVANASPEPFYWAGEKHVIQKVGGSRFAMSSSDVSAGIQIVDIVPWLAMRGFSGDSLPSECLKLMTYVIRKAYVHDFSFRGVSGSLHEQYDAVFSAPLTPDQLAKGKEIRARFEERRQENLREYRETKRLSLRDDTVGPETS